MLTPQQALEKYFGFSHFRQGQEEAIQRVLNNQHTLLVMPTGSGKSLAYQLPALLKPGLSLVISPLIALMKDQVDGLVEAGLPATYINSTLPNYEVNQRTRAVLEGVIKLLYIAPERLRNRQFTQALAKTQVSLLAVDEAHCISQWGHDFRPDYLQIGPTWQAMGQPTLLATTATATPKVQKDILKLLGVEQAQTIVTGFNRPNLTFRAEHAPDDRTKLHTLEALLKRHEGSVIVYTATRRNADDVADFIHNIVGLPAHSYHAGLDRDLRGQVQNNFMADRIKVVVATNAFGMGVDKPDVRAVIHYNLPATVEAYYQEAGRAGRDGLPAECVLFYAPDDQGLQEWLINSDTPSYDDLHQVYTLLYHAAEGGEVHIISQELAFSAGLHPVKLRVALSELEQAGLIYHLGNQGSYASWKVFPCSNEALEERAEAIQKRAQIRLDLLDNMLHYAHLTTCRRKFLLGYFGDVSPPKAPHCCDNHTLTDFEQLPKAVTPQDWFPLIALDTVRSLRQRPIGRNRLAQLLNGSQAQEMKQYGYNQHRFYGKLDRLNQKQILQLIDALIQARYLRLEGGKLPVLYITPAGAKALEVRAALPIRPPEDGLADIFQGKQTSRLERSNTVMETLALFNEGLTPAQIADRRALTEQTIYNHLARLISEGQIELHRLVSPEIENQILAAIETVGSTAALTPIKAILPETISFDQIRCVIAAHPELPKRGPSLSAAEKPEQRNPAPPPAQPPGSPASQPSPGPSPDVIVLEAVAKLGGMLGRTGLAQFLSGSKASWLETFSQHSCYGQLSHFSQKAVTDIIDALIADGELATTGGRRPKVVLPQGTGTAITSSPPTEEDSKVEPAVETDLTAAPSPPAPLPSGMGEVGGGKASPPTAPESPHTLLEALRAWRTNEARNQSLPPYIIFSNKVLETISAQAPTTMEELGEISGIGPAKLEKYGAAVVAIVAEALGVETQKESTISPPVEETPTEETPQAKKTREDTVAQSQKSKIETPLEAILAVLVDLGGLLTPQGLAQLLTAAPSEIVPFSDHKLCGVFHGVFSASALEREIQEAIAAKRITLTLHQRLVLAESEDDREDDRTD
jgi:ATP-dependent DNA helicase RecQ